MKRGIILWVLVLALLTACLPVYASAASIEILVTPSKALVNLGDTVEYVVTATGQDVVAMQFELRGSEGLSYVPNSGATPKNLAQKLGVPAADWTEISKMFTFYNDVGITMQKGTEILRFSCKAEKVGTYAVTLYELLPYDSNFEYFDPEITVHPVTVRNLQGQTQPPATQPVVTEPPATQPVVTEPPATEPSVTEPAVTETQPVVTEPVVDPTLEVTQPVGEELPEETQPDATIVVDEPTDSQEKTQPATQESTTQENPVEEKKPGVLPWVILAIALAAAAVAVVFFLKKKKQS